MELPFSDLQVKVQNPGASMPLVLPVQVVCNQPEEVINDNIRTNARAVGNWLASQTAHGGTAILCGSGPSLGESLNEIRERVAAGGVVFALNAAARFLAEAGIEPDYQVILDAQRETADLVGPAKAHLFASQAHPDTFARAPGAVLWHLQVEGIDELLPDYPKPFALIGAASSVGTTALVVAFALGFRSMHCYGYDSSNRGEDSHVRHQPMNDGEPMCSVAFGGKHYRCSLTMKMQAERFPEVARLLERDGCKVAVHGYGLLPDIWNAAPENLSEREKYQRLWTMPNYRAVAPGEHYVDLFLKLAQPEPGASVLDLGCGTGRASLKLHLAGLDVTLVDFTSNSRDVGAAHLRFFEWDLTEPMPFRAEYGYCTDVLEHIPPKDLRAVIANALASTPRLFIAVDTKPDLCGALINQRLHLSVMSHDEWLALLGEYGRIEFHAQSEDSSAFYVVRTDE